jgi:hypothetical protein
MIKAISGIKKIISSHTMAAVIISFLMDFLGHDRCGIEPRESGLYVDRLAGLARRCGCTSTLHPVMSALGHSAT